MYKPTNLGGFGLPKTQELNEAIKMRQLIRAMTTGHIFGKLQQSWLPAIGPYEEIKTKDPVTLATYATLDKHANEWLDRSESLNEHVT
jgi:hypothetical protein